MTRKNKIILGVAAGAGLLVFVGIEKIKNFFTGIFSGAETDVVNGASAVATAELPLGEAASSPGGDLPGQPIFF